MPPPGLRRDQHLGITRLERGDAPDAAVHPVSYGAECVVIEARHLAGVDGAVGQHGVPALPDRRRTHGDGVEPGRALTLEQQAIGLIEVAGRGQRVENVRSAGEAGLDVVAALSDELRKSLPGQLCCLHVEQTKDDRQRVHRFGITVDRAVIVNVVLVEGGFRTLCELSEMRGIPTAPK